LKGVNKRIITKQLAINFQKFVTLFSLFLLFIKKCDGRFLERNTKWFGIFMCR